MTTTLSQYNFQQQLTSARVIRTTNLSGVYINGQLNNGVGATLTASSAAALVIDSVSVVVGDRVLLAAQSSANQNGVYVVSDPGSASSVWVLTRSDDQQSIEQFKAGQFIPISAGTQGAGSMYVLVEPLPAALGVDSLVYNPTSDPASGSFLVASNNLSDVSNASTSRTNLGLGSGATANISAKQATLVGGGTTFVVTDAAVVAGSIVVGSISSSTNAVDLQKVTAGAGDITFVFSADPGATIVKYIAVIAAQ